MGAKYTAIQIAKYFINKAVKEEDKKLTPLKLQKILYYAQGWYLANFNKPLFQDRIEAWKYGPAIRSIYKEYEAYGNQPIKDVAIEESELSLIGPNDQKYLDKIWEFYKDYSASELVASTHNERPWRETRLEIQENVNSDIEIPLTTIKDYFVELLRE